MMTIRVLYLALLVVGLGAEFAMTVEPQGAGSQHTDAYLSDQDLDVRASARATNGYWFHAGRRNLDPRVFGTVVAPFGTNPVAGVPLDKRLSDGQGNWTTTAAAIPVSNVTSALEPGSFASVSVRDRTPTDRPSFSSTTYDEVELEVVAITAEGLRVEITANTPLPRGPHHEFFGGVGTNVVQHGRTGIGIKLVPRSSPTSPSMQRARSASTVSSCPAMMISSFTSWSRKERAMRRLTRAQPAVTVPFSQRTPR